MKKVLALVLVLVLCTGCVSAVAEEDYKWEKWADEYCKKALELNWIDENLPKDFTKDITREEFCVMADKVIQSCGYEIDFERMNPKPFTDTDCYEVAYLYALGVISGKSRTLFCPDDLITREEAAVLFSRIVELWNMKKSTAMTDWAYNDHKDISDWAVDRVYYVSEVGIMEGMGDGFVPKGSFEIQQAITCFVRLYNLVKPVNEETQEAVLFADKMNAVIEKDKNYMFSPLSIKMAFALIANGADDETKEEIMNVFDIKDLDDFNEYSKNMIELYKQSEAIDLNIANSVWVNRSITKSEFDGDFEFIANEYYNSEIGKVVRSNAVDTINEWVTKKTNDKIDRIISSPDFYVAVINAVYFNAKWKMEFDENSTAPDTFYNADNSEIETDFMNQKSYFNYCETDSARIIELPYRSDSFTISGTDEEKRLDISMYILLSDEEINVINQLNRAEGNYERKMVKLSMPKFEFSYLMDLREALELLGMDRAFNGGFSNILEDEDLLIDSAVHKTYIKVNEKETEAAAVTGIIATATAMNPTEVIEFKADKPFHFVIRDNESGEILFMGRYAYAG